MSFFKLLTKMVTKPDDEVAQMTEGIVSGNSMIKDGSNGRLSIRPNIPKISLSSSSSEKYNKALNFIKGNRQTIIEPIDPMTEASQQMPVNDDVMPPELSLSGNEGDGQGQSQTVSDYQIPDSLKMLGDILNPPNILSAKSEAIVPETNQESEGTTPSPNLRRFPPSPRKNPYAQDNGFGSSGDYSKGLLDGILNPQEDISKTSQPTEPDQNQVAKTLENIISGETKSSSTNEAVNVKGEVDLSDILPDAPVDKELPNESDKKYSSPKWKDIVVGILANIRDAKLSGVPPKERLGAFLGSIAGGAIEGGAGKNYAGRIGYQNDVNKTRQENVEARKIYEEKLGNAAKRQGIKNAQTKPILDQQGLEIKQAGLTLKEQANTIRQEQVRGKISKDEGDLRVKMLQYHQKDRQFAEKLKGYATFKTTLNADGTYTLAGVRKDGTAEVIRFQDGTDVKMADPNAWAKVLQDIKASELEAVAALPPENPDDRINYIEEKVRASGIVITDADSRREKKEKQDQIEAVRKQAGDSFDKARTNNRERSVNKAKSTGTKRVLNKRRSKSNAVIGGAVKGIDYSVQFKNRQKSR